MSGQCFIITQQLCIESNYKMNAFTICSIHGYIDQIHSMSEHGRRRKNVAVVVFLD